MDFEKKVVLIAGSLTEECKTAAAYFRKQGNRVILLGENTDQSLGEDADYHPCSLSDIMQIRRWMTAVKDSCGRVDRLIIWDSPKPAACPSVPTEEDWERRFHLSVKSAFFLAQESASVMEAGAGIIFLYATEAYTYSDCPDVIYSLAQGTLRTMTGVLAETLGKRGIAVNGICLARNDLSKKDLLRYPLGTVTAEDLIGAIEFLCSKDAAYLSGNTLTLDSGNFLFYRRYAAGK